MRSRGRHTQEPNSQVPLWLDKRIIGRNPLIWAFQNTTFVTILASIHTVSRNTPFVKLVMVGRNAVPRDVCGYGCVVTPKSTHVDIIKTIGTDAGGQGWTKRDPSTQSPHQSQPHGVGSVSHANPNPSETQLNSTQSQSRNLIVEAPYPNSPEKKYIWASPPLYIPTIRRFHRCVRDAAIASVKSDCVVCNPGNVFIVQPPPLSSSPGAGGRWEKGSTSARSQDWFS